MEGLIVVNNDWSYLTSDVERHSVLNILSKIESFVQQHLGNQNNIYKVLNAFPGHGKTTALKCFLKKVLEQRNHQISGLIVLREKEQMHEFEDFLGANNILYVDSDNFSKVKEEIPKAQFVLITHERLKNLVLLGKWKDYFLNSGTTRRIIFIDEAPTFFKSTVFNLNSNLKWLDDCFKVLKDQISAAEVVMIRSFIQIMIAKELFENNGLQTNALHWHLDSDTYKNLMRRFMKMVDEKLFDMDTVDSINAFIFFKRMYEQENIGFIDPAIHLGDFMDHKKIICSDRIDYRTLGCSILIFDGTAVFSQSIYKDEYNFIPEEVPNLIDYGRLHLHHRKINTSARRRKATKRISTQKIIAKDLKSIYENRGIEPIPLMNKDEIIKYRELDVINEANYNRYFKKRKDEKKPLNILNTVGKNDLREESILYLTSLPNRPPEHYKAIAISLYKDEEQTLNLSTVHKDKKDMNNWFVDDRIEQIYHEVLLSEINQIIHRSKIRYIASKDEVHIYIATQSDSIIPHIRAMFKGHKFTVSDINIEKDLTFESDLDEKVAYLAKTIKEKNIIKPTSIGRIEDGHSVKVFINKAWKDEAKRKKIIKTFNLHGLEIFELENKEKRIKPL